MTSATGGFAQPDDPEARERARTGSVVDQLRGHFGHRQHLYGVLLDEMARDLELGGPTERIFRDHLDAPRREAVHLRLLAAIYRIVLRGGAPELVPFYPSLGGDADPEHAWAQLRPLLDRHSDELRASLDSPLQTNEVGRSTALALGLFEAARGSGLRRVRLLELGASAGLNLNVDRYRLIGPDWSWGPGDARLVLDTGVGGIRPAPLEIVERGGCDLSPVPIDSEVARRHLTSFVWPFELERHARLQAALDVASAHPVVVDQATASTWLEQRLAVEPGDDVLTVVWQSITEQYWTKEESEAVAALVAGARSRMPVVRVRMEGLPPRCDDGRYEVAVHGPTVSVDDRVVARCHHHGPPLVPVGS